MIWARWCIAIVMLLIAPSARADGPTITGVQAGWDMTLPVDAWAPFRVTVQGADRPVSGAIVISTLLDGREMSRFRRPFASAPARTTTFEIPIRVTDPSTMYRSGEREFVVALVSGDGKRLDDWSSMPEDPNDLPLISLDYQTTRTDSVLFVTAPSSPAFALPDVFGLGPSRGGRRARMDERGQSLANIRIGKWLAIDTRSVGIEVLPSRARLLESVGVMVMHTQTLTRLAAARRDAVLGWVEAGGRLVLVGSDISVDASIRPADASIINDTIEPERAPKLERTRWHRGLGTIALLPSQPADVSSDIDARLALWLGVLEVPQREDQGWYSGSRVEIAEQREVDRIVDRFEGIEPPSVWWLFFFVALLAFCIGPVDRFALKRLKQLHRSWASALVWIGIASVGATVIPSMLATGTPHAGQLTRADVAPDGSAFVDRTIAFYANRAHRARTADPSDGVGRWQHTPSGIGASRGFFTPVSEVGNGATLPPLSMRARSLLAVQESSVGHAPPVTVELSVDEAGEVVLVLTSEREFVVERLGLWTDRGVAIASGVEGRGDAARTSRFEARFPFPPQHHRSFFESTPFDEPSAEQRALAMELMLDRRDIAYACIALTFPDAPPIAGAPEGAPGQSEFYHARLPVELDDSLRSALDARTTRSTP